MRMRITNLRSIPISIDVRDASDEMVRRYIEVGGIEYVEDADPYYLNQDASLRSLASGGHAVVEFMTESGDLIGLPAGGAAQAFVVATSGGSHTSLKAAVGGVTDRLQRSELLLSVPDALPGSLIALSLFRDARVTNPGDTYTGAVKIVSITLEGTFWR